MGAAAAAAAAGGGGGGGGVVHRPRRERRGSLYAPGTLLLLLPSSIDNSKTCWGPAIKDFQLFNYQSITLLILLQMQ